MYLKTWQKCLLGRGKKDGLLLALETKRGRNQKPLLQTAQWNLSWGFFSCLLIAIDTFNHAFKTRFFFVFQCHDTRLLHAFDKIDTGGFICPFSHLISLSITLRTSKFRNQFNQFKIFWYGVLLEMRDLFWSYFFWGSAKWHLNW